MSKTCTRHAGIDRDCPACHDSTIKMSKHTTPLDGFIESMKPISTKAGETEWNYRVRALAVAVKDTLTDLKLDHSDTTPETAESPNQGELK